MHIWCIVELNTYGTSLPVNHWVMQKTGSKSGQGGPVNFNYFLLKVAYSRKIVSTNILFTNKTKLDD